MQKEIFFRFEHGLLKQSGTINREGSVCIRIKHLNGDVSLLELKDIKDISILYSRWNYLTNQKSNKEMIKWKN